MNNINDLKPFGRFCVTLGMIPTSYKESLTYEEQLIWLCNYLETEVIPKYNENVEAINELITLYNQLKSYVDNYFENLDVQEEINNKLDEMASDGTLEEIITTYINLKGMICFNTVSDMKIAENLVNGSFVKTYGYYNVNDGGEATYKIREIINTDVVDESFLIALNDENLVAELIVDSPLNVLKLGVKNDNSEDISTIINNATQKVDLYFPIGTYKVSNQLNQYNSFYGENYVRMNKNGTKSALLKSNITCSFSDKEEIGVIDVSNINSGANINNIAISLKDYEVGIKGVYSTGKYLYINHISIDNVKSSGINITCSNVSRGLYLDYITVFGTAESYEDSTGIKIHSADYKVSNIEVMGCRVGCNFKGFVQGSHYHIWCGSMLDGDGVVNHTQDESWFRYTKCMITGACMLDDVYLDTGYFKLYGEGDIYYNNTRCISNLKTYDDNSMPTFTDGNGVNFQNWYGTINNYLNFISNINYRNTFNFNCTYNNVRNITGVNFSKLTQRFAPGSRYYDVSYNLIKDITSTEGKIIEIGKIKVPSWSSGIMELYILHSPVRPHKIQLRFNEGYYTGCIIDSNGTNDEKIYISNSKDSNDQYTLYIEPFSKSEEYITVEAKKISGFENINVVDLGFYDEFNFGFTPNVLSSTTGLTQLVNS